jgi:hypothetical protein
MWFIKLSCKNQSTQEDWANQLEKVRRLPCRRPSEGVCAWQGAGSAAALICDATGCVFYLGTVEAASRRELQRRRSVIDRSVVWFASLRFFLVRAPERAAAQLSRNSRTIITKLSTWGASLHVFTSWACNEKHHVRPICFCPGKSRRYQLKIGLGEAILVSARCDGFRVDSHPLPSLFSKRAGPLDAAFFSGFSHFCFWFSHQVCWFLYFYGFLLVFLRFLCFFIHFSFLF